MKALTFEITGRVASAKNHGLPITLKSGRKMVKKSKAAEKWAAHAVQQLVAQRPPMRPITEPVRLTIQFHGPLDHPWTVDGDNGENGVWDALTAAQIIDDDCPRIGRGCTWDYFDAPYPNWKVVLMLTPYQTPA